MATLTFNPQFAIKSFNNLLNLCDDIWYFAGDKSSDVNNNNNKSFFLVFNLI